MPIGTLLLGLALMVIAGFIIALPLLDKRKPALQPPSKRAALEAERQDTVRAIHELDFDYRTHKINDDDYKHLREALDVLDDQDATALGAHDDLQIPVP